MPAPIQPLNGTSPNALTPLRPDQTGRTRAQPDRTTATGRPDASDRRIPAPESQDRPPFGMPLTERNSPRLLTEPNETRPLLNEIRANPLSALRAATEGADRKRLAGLAERVSADQNEETRPVPQEDNRRSDASMAAIRNIR